VQYNTVQYSTLRCKTAVQYSTVSTVLCQSRKQSVSQSRAKLYSTVQCRTARYSPAQNYSIHASTLRDAAPQLSTRCIAHYSAELYRVITHCLESATQLGSAVAPHFRGDRQKAATQYATAKQSDAQHTARERSTWQQCAQDMIRGQRVGLVACSAWLFFGSFAIAVTSRVDSHRTFAQSSKPWPRIARRMWVCGPPVPQFPVP
jgi:hypothetical protein